MTTLMRSLLLSFALLMLPMAAKAGVFVSVRIGPPPLPVYEQPWAPGPGYLWSPGYWAYDQWYDDYYWVPGTWVRPPRVGLLWTPGYWAWDAGYYSWYPGYWGPRVGYYGGINYGYGYTGHGYHGGYWRDNHFWYNSYVNRVRGDSSRYTYRQTVNNNITINRVSYNGGDGGTRAQPSRDDENYRRQGHVDVTDEQARHERAAREDRGLRLKENRGRPATLAVPTAARIDAKREREIEARRSAPRDQGDRDDNDRRNDRGLDDDPRVMRGNQSDAREDRGAPRDRVDRDVERAPRAERIERPDSDDRRGNRSRDDEEPTVIRGSRIEDRERVDEPRGRPENERPRNTPQNFDDRQRFEQQPRSRRELQNSDDVQVLSPQRSDVPRQQRPERVERIPQQAPSREAYREPREQRASQPRHEERAPPRAQPMPASRETPPQPESRPPRARDVERQERRDQGDAEHGGYR